MKYKVVFSSIAMTFLMSCHWQSEIAVIQNNTKDTIITLPWNDKDFGPVTDSILYNDRVDLPYWIYPNSSDMITLPNRKFKNAPNLEMVDLYIFDLDTLNYLKKVKQNSGILRRSLLKKISIQANAIESPVDTYKIVKPPSYR